MRDLKAAVNWDGTFWISEMAFVASLTIEIQVVVDVQRHGLHHSSENVLRQVHLSRCAAPESFAPEPCDSVPNASATFCKKWVATPRSASSGHSMNQSF